MRAKRVIVGSVATAVLAAASWLPSLAGKGDALGTSAFTVVATQPVVVVERAPAQPVQPQLGVVLTSPSNSLTIVTKRSSYRTKWVSTLSLSRRDGRRIHSLRLPSGAFTSIGLRNVGEVVMRSQSGAVVARGLVGWCPGQAQHEAIAVDAVAEPVYPTTCEMHVFAFARINGIERGWGSAVWTLLSVPPSVPDGDYNVDLTVNATTAKRLGMVPSARSAHLVIHLVTTPGLAPSASTSAASADSLLAETLDTHPLAAPAVASPPRESLPDLASLPAFWIRTRDEDGRDILTFAANTWNRGPAPLVVEGYRIPGTDTMDAQQILYANGAPVGSHPVGQMMYHRAVGHYHWHFLDYTRYDLTDVTKKRAVVTTSGKQSWCIAPTDAIDLTLPGAVWRPQDTSLASACGNADSQWLRLVLPAGWGDTYYQLAAGQSIDITDVPNGRYYIKVTANPEGRLLERSTTNNVSYRLVILGGTPGARTVVVPAYQGLKTT